METGPGVPSSPKDLGHLGNFNICEFEFKTLDVFLTWHGFAGTVSSRLLFLIELSVQTF